MRASKSVLVVSTAVWVPGCFAPEPAPLVLSGTDSSGGSSGTAGDALSVDCQAIPLAAVGATWSFTPPASGLVEGVTYMYSASALPSGLTIDEDTGEIAGVVAVAPGSHVFEVTIAEPEGQSAVTVCNLEVRERLTAPIDIGHAPCLRPGDDLRDLVSENTGDGSPITCDIPGGDGNGRKPNGVDVDGEGCTITDSIAEDRYGTWVFMMRGTQSGVDVFVPYCVTNDEEQGYEITGRHGINNDAALDPIVREYDPFSEFSVGSDMDPRYEITASGVCGASCFYKYSFLRTNAPVGVSDGFSLDPDGLLQDGRGQNIGFYHELRVSGPPVPEEFESRPWVLSVAVSYCISGDFTGCDEIPEDAPALEIGLIMVPQPS